MINHDGPLLPEKSETAPNPINNIIDMREKRLELLQREAKLLAASKMLPDQFRGKDQAETIANCSMILEMAEKLDVDALTVARNIYFVHNKPTFSTKFAIGLMNAGKVLRGRLEYVNVGEPGKPSEGVFARGVDAKTGVLIVGPTVTMEMANAEGWTTKNGSKWKTMRQLMLQYRAASFFINVCCPEIMFGMSTIEEANDAPEIRDITPKKNKQDAIAVSEFDDDARVIEGNGRVIDGGQIIDEETGEIIGNA